MLLCIFFFTCSDGTRINHRDKRRDVIIVVLLLLLPSDFRRFSKLFSLCLSLFFRRNANPAD